MFGDRGRAFGQCIERIDVRIADFGKSFLAHQAMLARAPFAQQAAHLERIIVAKRALDQRVPLFHGLGQGFAGDAPLGKQAFGLGVQLRRALAYADFEIDKRASALCQVDLHGLTSFAMPGSPALVRLASSSFCSSR